MNHLNTEFWETLCNCTALQQGCRYQEETLHNSIWWVKSNYVFKYWGHSYWSYVPFASLLLKWFLLMSANLELKLLYESFEYSYLWNLLTFFLSQRSWYGCLMPSNSFKDLHFPPSNHFRSSSVTGVTSKTKKRK